MVIFFAQRKKYTKNSNIFSRKRKNFMSEAKNMKKGQNWPFFETMGRPLFQQGFRFSPKIELFEIFCSKSKNFENDTPKLVIFFRVAKKYGLLAIFLTKKMTMKSSFFGQNITVTIHQKSTFWPKFAKQIWPKSRYYQRPSYFAKQNKN